MNRSYCVVFNASRGLWVVASELARGKKKSNQKSALSKTSLLAILPALLLSQSALAADCATSSLPFTGGASAGVRECYISGSLQDIDGDGKINGVDGTDSANYKNKNQSFSSDTTFSLSNGIQWLPAENGSTAPLPVSSVSASELYNKGALTVTDKDGNTLSALPEFTDWNLNAVDGKKQLSWTKTDGTTGYADVYDTSALEVTKDIDSATNFSAQIITAQPTQPFIQLTLATIKDGAKLDLISDGEKNSDGFAIDWKPGQVKQSSLFIADNSTINQAANTPIRVIFSYTEGVNNPANTNPESGKFGPTKALPGSTIAFQGKNYLIDSNSALETYNQALIAAIKDNTLTSSDYDGWFRKAFKDVAPEYTYTYDPTKVDYTDYFISPEMSAAIGKRAIFEATGTGVVNLNANVAAIGQTWARAYNAWAHDSGAVNNLGGVVVDNAKTQNALVESGAKFNNSGSLTFNVDGTNWADQVTGAGSTYTNNAGGVISVSSSKKNNSNTVHPNRYYKNSRNIATEILDGASGINNGSYFIGIAEPSGKVGTATGAHITNSGSFTNNGAMTIGKDAEGNSVPLKGGSATETLYVDEAYNAISAYVNNSGSPVNITNGADGNININDSAQNSAAINIGADPVLTNTTGSVFTPKNVTVVNAGNIDVAGKNSAGLKAVGAFTAANSDRIVNTGTINVSGAGSSGIISASGAEIINDGNVIVTGTDSLGNRAYGIRADNATVSLENNSNLTVKGSNTTGLYARTGGLINVNGGTIDAPKDASASNQVVFWVSGKNSEGKTSTISFSDPTSYSLANSNSTLFRVDQCATYDGSSSNLVTVNVNGSGSKGYTIATKGTTFTSGGTTISVNGDNATGININSGAGTDDKVKLSGETQITVTGSGSTIATVDGNTYNLLGKKVGQDGAKLITEAQLTAGNGGHVAENAIGYKVINKGELVQNGAIDFSNASDTTGVYIDGGTLTNNGTITSNGIGVDVYQTGAGTSVVNNASNITAVDGTAAIHLNNKASLKVSGSGTISGSGSADAIRVMSGARLTTNGANINVDGSGSGIHFLNTAGDAAGSTFRLSGSGNINVSGNNAAGITLEGQDSSGNPVQSNANMDTRGSEKLVINVNDKGGNGIVTNTSGYVYSGTSVNINSPAGQSALVVKGATTDIKQTGNLTSSSNASPVVDLTQLTDPASSVNLINSGKITANGSVKAVDASSHSGKVNVTNSGSGNIKGDVALGDGSNVIALKDSSVADGITTGNGNNAITVQNSAKLTGTLTAGNGANTLDLKNTSQTNAVVLGNGGNKVNIYGGTHNGTLTSGSGNDSYTLHAVNVGNAKPTQSSDAFSKINGGAGTDLLTVTDGSWYTLNDAASIQNMDNLNVEKNSTFEVKNTDLALNNAGAGANVVSLDHDSTYFINFDATPTDYRLKQNIRGDGTIRTNTNGKAFDFDNAAYTRDNFTGTLALGNGQFTVAGDNTSALTNATLQLDADGLAILEKDQPTQVIGGLRFNSGTLFVQEDFIGSQENALQSHMQVTDLDISGEGAVHIVANGFDNDYNPQKQLEDLSRKSLLRQDEGNTLVTIVMASGEVIGKAVDIVLDLTKPDGFPLPGSEDQQQDIRQGGEKVATGTYGIGGGTGELGDGLYAAYLLKQIDIVGGKTVNLVTSPGDIKNSLDLSAKLTGAGNVSINGYGDYLSLSNHHNDYTGSTTVNYGTLVLADDTVLGQADKYNRALNLLTGTQAKFGSTTQYIGQLNSATNSTVALEKGTLNVASGGSVAGQITSAPDARLNVNGGTLDIASRNPGYHGTTTIASSATTNIHHIAGLGAGAIALAGTLNVIKAAAGNLVNKLSGEGKANILSGSDVNLTGNNAAFNGSFNVDGNSVLRASSAQNIGDGPQIVPLARAMVMAAASTPADIHNNGDLVLTNAQAKTWTVNNLIDGTGDLYKQGSGTLALTQQAAKYTGQTWVTKGALTAGEESSPVNMATSALNIAQGASFGGYGSTAGAVNNQGTFYVGGLDKTSLNTATTYQVKGNFSNAGDIVLGSNNVTGSTLNIGGDYLSRGGSLYLNTVLNKGFAETDTDQMLVSGNVRNSSGATRIFVQNVGGKGAFTQPDAIKLVDVKGRSDSDAFVLGRPTVIGVYEYRLNRGVGDDSWYLSSFNPNQGVPDLHYVNPMIGAFAANQNALSMFNMTLHDRLGEPQYAENLRQDGDFAHSLWLRVEDSHQRYDAINNQLRIDGHSTVVQLGHGIIHWSDNQNWRGRVGIMGAVGNQQFTSKSHRTGSRATANIDSAYSVGMYGTLYQNDENPLGTYVDTWALYNWYNNSVGMSGYSDAKYDSHGYNLSIETGHTWVFAKVVEKQREWQLQPQAQLTYGQLTSDAANSDSGLTIGKTKSASLESRLGARLTRVYNFKEGQSVQPFVEANWRHQFRDNTLTFNERYDFNNQPPKNRYELKVGVEGQRNKNLNGWANISYSVGDKEYREPKAMIGIKYQW